MQVKQLRPMRRQLERRVCVRKLLDFFRRLKEREQMHLWLNSKLKKDEREGKDRERRMQTRDYQRKEYHHRELERKTEADRGVIKERVTRLLELERTPPQLEPLMRLDPEVV